MGQNKICTGVGRENAGRHVVKRQIGRGSVADVHLGKQTVLIGGVVLISTTDGFSDVSPAKLTGII